MAINDLIVIDQPRGKFITATTMGGSGSITGRVLEMGLPVIAEVALHDRRTRHLVALTWSDANGNYSFNGLDKNREYYVQAIHPTRKFNAVAQDMLRGNYDTNH